MEGNSSRPELEGGDGSESASESGCALRLAVPVGASADSDPLIQVELVNPCDDEREFFQAHDHDEEMARVLNEDVTLAFYEEMIPVSVVVDPGNDRDSGSESDLRGTDSLLGSRMDLESEMGGVESQHPIPVGPYFPRFAILMDGADLLPVDPQLQVDPVDPLDCDDDRELLRDGEIALSINEDHPFYDEPMVDPESDLYRDGHDTHWQAGSPGLNSEPGMASMEYHPYLTGPLF